MKQKCRFPWFLGDDSDASADALLLLRAVPARCVDLVEDCKKATSIHFLSRKKVKSKQRKQNLY